MIRTPLAGLLVAALGLAAFATGARSENRPFERESAGAQTELAMPTSMTPPVSVRGIDGAPAGWNLAERVAEALRSRDIAASAASRRRSDFVLKGEMRLSERNGRSRVELVWSLYDALGKKVGVVTQTAAVPGAAIRARNDAVVVAIAVAAAESIAPLIPSSSNHSVDGAETGKRHGNDRVNLALRDRITADGKVSPTPLFAKKPLALPKRETKPLPLPQRVETETASPPADSEESLSAIPNPASDTGLRSQAATLPPPPERPRQIAENPAPRRETRPEQYAERPSRAASEYWIQVGSNKDEAASRAQWEQMQSTAQGVFANIGYRIQRADLGARGVYYRVQVGPFASPGAAGQFCAQLKARQIDCFLPAPEPVSASARPPEAAPKKAAQPAPKPAAKPAEPAAPKMLAKPVEPKVTPKPAVKQAEPKSGVAPAEKPKEASAVPKSPDADLPPPLPESKPPKDSSDEKPDAPISTAPGLPGVLD